MFEFADGAFDAVAHFGDGWIEGAVSGHAFSLRNDRYCAIFLDVIADGVAVIGLVGENVARQEPGLDEANRLAQRIDGDVPFAGQSASGAPLSLVADPPFWPVAA